LLPNSDVQRGVGGAFGGTLLALFAGVAVTGAAGTLWAGRQLRRRAPDVRSGLFGFEVPLLSALAFGMVVWFGMRQAVIVSANNVDTPGDIAQFDRAVDLFPNLGLAYYLRGERHLAKADFAQPGDPAAMAARDDFSEAIKRDPGFPASYLARGRVLVGLGEYDAAIADANALIALRPEHPGGYAIRALAHAGSGDLGAAADDLALATRPLDENARGWDAYFIRCLALVAASRLDEAKADCLKVLESNPNQIVTLDQLVLIAEQQDDDAAALGYLDRMIAIDDTNFKTWANRGLFHRRLGDYAEANADLTRALELNPDDAFSYRERALTRLYLDRGDDALADANDAVRVAPGERYTRLYVARYTEQIALVIEDTTAILSSLPSNSPNFPYLHSVRGLALVESGDVESGFADLDEALRDPVDQPGAFDRRGYARILTGDHAGAESDLDEALRGIALLPEQSRAELHYHRALLFQAAGRIDAARAEVEESLKHVEIPAMRRQIEALQAELPN
jgi:tetratricopeptide (TPR) repeat protein